MSAPGPILAAGQPVFYVTGRDAVLDICALILEEGAESSPRGQRTKELLGCYFGVQDPWDTLPTGIGRKNLQPAIAAAEALQNISGFARPGLMSRISSFFPAPTSRWDSGIPTYGERLAQHDQLAQVVAKLKADPDSRQAVALIWRPDDMWAGQAHNLCTIGLQFMVRDIGGEPRLLTFAHMRSNDAWYGLCYDMFQFAAIGLTIAKALGVEPGPYVHTANSMHLYERHWQAASELAPEPRGNAPFFHGVGRQGMGWETIRNRASMLLDGLLPSNPTGSEEWLAKTLAPFEPAGD